MSVNEVSLTNRRFVLLAVMSLIASLFAVSAHAPAASATNEAVEFTSLTGSIGESGTSTTVEVTLTADEATLGANVSVDIEVTGGSATGSGTDYTYSTATVTFTSGVSLPATDTVTVTIDSDTDHEPNETIVFGLTNETPGTDIVSGNTSHTLTITDDDDATVEFTNATSGLTENTATHTETLTLTVPGGGTLQGDVTVDVTAPSGTATGSGTDYTLTTTLVTFANGSADGATQNVNISILEDTDHEPNETIGLSMDVATGRGANGAQTGHTVTITDEDNATVEFTNATSGLTENTATHTETLTLTVPGGGTLQGDVTVDVTAPSGTATGSGTDYTLTTTLVTFANGSADGATQNVNISILEDTLAEGDETIGLSMDVATGRGANGAQTGHTVTITDDESAPTVQFTAGTSAAGESTATHNISVTLDTGGGTTTSAITVPITDTGGGTATSGTDYNGSFGSAVFPSGSTDGATQNATITVTPDSLIEGDETINLGFGTITGATASGTTSHTHTITDDESAPTVQFTAGTSAAGESTATHNISVTLDTGGGTTTSAITVPITDTGGGTATSGTDYNGSFGSAVFPSGSTDGATQNATITVTPDLIDEGDETINLGFGTITGATASGTTSHTHTITDDDVAGVTISGSPVAVTEGSTTDTYTVVLTSNPTADVNVTITPDGQVTTDSGGALTFTPTGGATPWNVAQTVTVTAFNDSIHEASPHTGTVTHSATGGGYDSVVIANVTANITDNDPASVTFLNAASNAQEDGGTHSITVRLAVPGGGDLLAPLGVNVPRTGGSATPGSDFSYSPATVTFLTGASNGDDKTVGISITDDGAQESPETIVFGFSGISGGVVGTGNTTHTVTIIDDETRNFVVTQSGGGIEVAEASGTDTFDVHLTQAPTGTVTVTLSETTLDDEFNVSPTTLTFTTGNWMNDQTVTVTGVNDAYDDGDLNGVITLTGANGGYTGVTATESVTITDDDTAGVTITESGAGTAVTEGGATDTYTVVLDARPTSNVTVAFSYNSAELSLDKTGLTFTTSNWSTAQTVTVSGVADGAAEQTETLTIQHSTASADTPFDTLPVASVDVSITNVDELQVTIEGPSVGVPGIGATFEAIQNASGTGEVVYLWQVLENNLLLPGVSGTNATFTFTPDDGGNYVIWAQISDDISNTAFFIDFTVMGDVAGSVFANAIIWLAEEGITKGCTQDGTSFCPNDFVTRGQMAAFLVRFLDLTDDGGGDLFVDDNTSIFEDNIDKLATAGITRGCNPPTNDRFCPEDRVTRGQMAAFLVRALNLTDNGGGNLFQDDDGSVFENNIDILATAGITRGCNPPANTNFCPNNFVTRGQMAAFLQRAADLLP